LGDRGPLLSFSFDDFPRTAYTVGGAILQNFGARATYYVAMGLINTANEMGPHFRLDDLYSLAEEGHELASHTLRHTSCRAVPFTEFREDVQQGRVAIRKTTGFTDSGNFAYPYGHVTLKAKRMSGTEMRSCRGIFPGINGPEVDLDLLCANSLYGDVERFSQIERWILENEKRRGWLILYSHDVRRQPSRFGCTPSLLEAAIACAIRRGTRVLTVAEVLAEIDPQPNQPAASSTVARTPASKL